MKTIKIWAFLLFVLFGGLIWHASRADDQRAAYWDASPEPKGKIAAITADLAASGYNPIGLELAKGEYGAAFARPVAGQKCHYIVWLADIKSTWGGDTQGKLVWQEYRGELPTPICLKVAVEWGEIRCR